MRKYILITSIALASMAAAPAATAKDSTDQSRAQAATATSTSSTAATAPEEKKICKLLPETGSRMSKRSCLTKQEWEKVAEDTGIEF